MPSYFGGGAGYVDPIGVRSRFRTEGVRHGYQTGRQVTGGELTDAGREVYGDIRRQYQDLSRGADRGWGADIPSMDVDRVLSRYNRDEIASRYPTDAIRGGIMARSAARARGQREELENLAGRRGESGFMYYALPRLQQAQEEQTGQELLGADVERGRFLSDLAREYGRLGADTERAAQQQDFQRGTFMSEQQARAWQQLLQAMMSDPSLARRIQESSGSSLTEEAVRRPGIWGTAANIARGIAGMFI